MDKSSEKPEEKETLYIGRKKINGCIRLLEIMQAGEQSEIFCVERKKKKKTFEFYPAKLSFISAGEINTFSDK